MSPGFHSQYDGKKKGRGAENIGVLFCFALVTCYILSSFSCLHCYCEWCCCSDQSHTYLWLGLLPGLTWPVVVLEPCLHSHSNSAHTGACWSSDSPLRPSVLAVITTGPAMALTMCSLEIPSLWLLHLYICSAGSQEPQPCLWHSQKRQGWGLGTGTKCEGLEELNSRAGTSKPYPGPLGPRNLHILDKSDLSATSLVMIVLWLSLSSSLNCKLLKRRDY